MAKLRCLFGGTFDPVHYGHLKPLDELRTHLSADAIHIIPASVPPHRPTPEASIDQRLRMLELALEEFPGFLLDRRELERDGPSWTVLTLQQLRREHPLDSLCLVMGSDAFAGLPSWYHWQQIFELANIVVIERPGAAIAEQQDWAASMLVSAVKALRQKLSGQVLPLRLTLYDISATQIRQALHRQVAVEGKLPHSVIAYIRQHGLYGAQHR